METLAAVSRHFCAGESFQTQTTHTHTDGFECLLSLVTFSVALVN